MSAPANGLPKLLLEELGRNLESINKIRKKPPITTRKAKGIEYKGTGIIKKLTIGRIRRV
jgi:hypothetical protein